MRLSTRVAVLCVGLLVSHHAAAAELPQRWVSAGGALSEWVSVLGGESKLLELIAAGKVDVVVIGSLHFDADLRSRLERACSEHDVRLLKFSFRLDNLNTAS